MSEMVKCYNPENGHEVEMPEHVTKDSGWMRHLGLVVKPEVKTISTKEIEVKIKDAKTIEELELIMEGETREACIKAAEKKRKQLEQQ